MRLLRPSGELLLCICGAALEFVASDTVEVSSCCCGGVMRLLGCQRRRCILLAGPECREQAVHVVSVLPDWSGEGSGFGVRYLQKMGAGSSGCVW